MSDGIRQLVAIKKETTWGTAAGATGSQYLPFVTANYQLEKDTYGSNSINPSQQMRDSRHGTRRATGTHNAELQCGAFEMLMAAAMRRDFTGAVTTGALTNISFSDTAPNILRAAGSFITDGFRVGQVVNISGAGEAGNNGAFVISAIASDGSTMTGFRMDEALMVDDTAGDSITISLAGQQTYAPLTGHTDDSFTIEDQQPGADVYRVTLGQQVNTMNINASPNAMVTIDFEFLGRDASPSTSSAYFTTPTAVPSTGTMSGPVGLLVVAGVKKCQATSFQLSVNNNIQQESGIGCESIIAKARGKIMASGSMTVVMDSDEYFEYFADESEIQVTYVLASASDEYFGMHMPRLKVNSATVDSGEKVRIVTVNFELLEYVGDDTTLQATTLVLQDSTLS